MSVELQPIGRRLIVDAHFHLWNLDENCYPWLSDGDTQSLVEDHSSLRQNYLVSDLLRDVGDLNVVAGVHIQAEHDNRDVVRETRWLQQITDMTDSRGFPQAIVADCNFALPDTERTLVSHCESRNVRGIRHAVNRRLDAAEPYDPLRDPIWCRNFSLLRKFNLSFDMQLFPRQADDAVRLIAANPDIKVIFTHAAMPIWRDAENMRRWKSALHRYAALPNTAIKVSGFGSFDRNWSPTSIEPVLNEVMEAFGPDRCMLGSNFPVDRLAKTYHQVWHCFSECFARYSASEQERLFCYNALKFYRLNINAPAYTVEGSGKTLA
jgi:predicted TIM-barrel fold metal-dependent hydrolase